MTSAATISRDHSEALFATPAIVADRRADGSIVLKSIVAVTRERALRRRLAGALGAAGAGRGFFSATAPASRCRGNRYLQGCAEAGSLGRSVDSGARAECRAAAGDPVRQQRRSCVVRTRRPACRRALGVDLAGLFADVAGFRQAQKHDRPARTRCDLRFRHQAVCRGTGGDRTAAFGGHRQQRRRRC